MDVKHDYSTVGDTPDATRLTEAQLRQRVQALETENLMIAGQWAASRLEIFMLNEDLKKAQAKEDDTLTDLWTLMGAMPRHGAKHSMDAYLIAGHEFALSVHEAQVDHHKHIDNVADKLVDMMLTAIRAGARQGMTVADFLQAVEGKQKEA